MLKKPADGVSDALTMKIHVFEFNLISAQGLKVPSANLRRTQTYALAWVDPSFKLRTRVDRVGAENPTWNDKFLFRVTPEFLASETSAIAVEIYAVGCIRDNLVGTVRFLVSNVVSFGSGLGTPAFTAVQVRRPSGRFHGVLNIGAMLIDGSDFASLSRVSAIGFRDLMGESIRHRRRRKSKVPGGGIPNESCENSCADSAEYSDGGDSSTSSSSTASTALKDWNSIRDLAGTKVLKASSGAGFLCCLVMQKESHLRPSDENSQVFGGPNDRER